MIEFSHVSFRYAAASARALKDVSFRVGAGELVVVTGRSGCGKSTLINLVNGLLPRHDQDESGGGVTICGRDVSSLEGYEIARLVGSVFQNPKSQFFNLDTDSEIAFGLENAGVPNPALRDRVEKTVAEVGIQELAGRSIFEMSGGQKQQVAIAGAYALGPEIFVLDEPSANLDHQATIRLTGLLRRLRSQGKALLVSEHRLGYLSDLADRYIVLDAGVVAGSYSADELRALSPQRRHAMGLRAFNLAEATRRRARPADLDGRPPAIEVTGLTVSFRDRTVLNNVSLRLAPGEVVGLIGDNGAGKTTLVRTLCGLQKAGAGAFALQGRPVRQRDLRGRVFLVMQDVNSQLFGETLAEECAIGLRHPSESDIDRVLEHLDLLELRDRHPLSLSGGQKQRAALASGLCSARSVLILDEPTSGLDRESMVSISDLVLTAAEAGTAVLVVSHDAEFLALVCTRVEELRGGALQPPPEGAEDPPARLREFFGRSRGDTTDGPDPAKDAEAVDTAHGSSRLLTQTKEVL